MGRWVTHGDDDSVVPSRNSDRFAKLTRESQSQTTLRYDLVPGEDHGFDIDMGKWADIYPEVMEFVKEGWLH